MVLEKNLENKAIKKKFSEMLVEDFKSRDLKENTLVKAKVVEIGRKFCIVDINGKSDGLIPLEEFKITNELEGLKVNSVVELYLERLEGPSGIVVSREKAKRMQSWNNLMRSFEKEEELTGIIKSRVRGGMVVDIDSCLTFCPGSQVDTKPLKSFEIDKLMNIPLKFVIVKMDKQRGNVVVSRRGVLEKKINKNIKEAMSNLKEGQIIKGARVKAIETFGAFIDIGNEETGPIDSLLHQSDISYNRIKRVGDLLSVGDQITVKVIKLDRLTNRCSVGIKQLGTDPWEGIEKKYSVGQKVLGKVSKIVEFGIFVEIDGQLQALCHNSELDYLNRNPNPANILSPSQEAVFKIIELRPEKKRISLSYKACFPSPWDELLKKYPVNSTVSCVAINLTDFGVFAKIEDSKLSGLLHKNDIDYDQKDENLKKFKKNTKFQARIVEIDKDKEKIRLNVKILKKDPFFEYFKDRKNGEIITVKVQSLLKNGIVVSPGNDDKLKITIKKSNLAKDPENQRIDVFSKNNKIDCMILDLNHEKRSVTLSIKDLEIRNEKEDIKKFGKDGSKSGAVLGDILGKVFKSKKTKKKN